MEKLSFGPAQNFTQRDHRLCYPPMSEPGLQRWRDKQHDGCGVLEPLVSEKPLPAVEHNEITLSLDIQWFDQYMS